MAEPLVADASLWLALFLGEMEGDAWTNRLAESPLLAPDLLPYELANGLMVAHKRKRFVLQEPTDDLLLALPNLELTWLSKEIWWAEALRIARKGDITIYDASYIAVAKMSDAILCSRDRGQLAVAMKEGLSPLSAL